MSKSLLSYLRDDQAEIIANPNQIKTIACGRRWGKTMMSGLYALTVAELGGAVAWVSPTYKNSRPLWRFCESAVNPQSVSIQRAEREISFPRGGHIGIYSADNDVSIRGEAFDLVIVDEAARVREETYADVLLPTIADRDGRMLLISTPHGRNWFFHEFLKAQQNGAAWNAPSAANPMPQIRKAAELAQERVSARAYRQEWLAEFIEDGSFFVNVLECATASAQDAAQEGHEYVIGVDWGRAAGGDDSVFTVLDATTRSVAHITRLNGRPFDYQLVILRGLHETYNNAPILAEYNSLGMKPVEDLQAAGLPVTAFTTSAASKHELMTALELAFNKKGIAILNDVTLLAQLQAFEVKPRAGLPAYGAPEGMHDDYVMSLALAWYLISAGGGVLFEI